MTNEKELREQLKNHICRFNDFPQECECFKAGFHSHTKEVVTEKIITKLNTIKEERKKIKWAGSERDIALKGAEVIINDLLASLEDNKPTEELLGKNAVIDYANDYSHYHCWNQTQPSACGIPLEKHTQCCLCGQIYEDNKITETYKPLLLVINQFGSGHLYYKENDFKTATGGSVDEWKKSIVDALEDNKK